MASVNYGEVPDDLTTSCPVIGSFGARDRLNPDAAQKLATRLETAGVPHDVREYADSGHAFLNDSLPRPAALAPLLHIAGFGGTRYDADDAWHRIEAYFAQHLPQPAAR